MPATLTDRIRTLEESLLHTDFSGNPQALQALIGEDYREVNPAGREVSRDSVIRWILEKNPDCRWTFTEYRAQSVAPGLVLATYHARQTTPEKPESRGARHCSLWRENPATGGWQLVFHQATQISDKR